jgi:hypothetical protein
MRAVCVCVCVCMSRHIYAFVSVCYPSSLIFKCWTNRKKITKFGMTLMPLDSFLPQVIFTFIDEFIIFGTLIPELHTVGRTERYAYVYLTLCVTSMHACLHAHAHTESFLTNHTGFAQLWEKHISSSWICLMWQMDMYRDYQLHCYTTSLLLFILYGCH